MTLMNNCSDDGHDNNKVTTLLSNERGGGATTRKRMGAVGTVVVAVDSERKASQHALKWAVDRLLFCRNNTSSSSHYRPNLTLLHVRHSAPLISFNYSYHTSNVVIEREADDQELEMLRSFRGFCARRQVKFEIVVVEDDDVAQALVDYAIRHRVENLLLGASSRNGFSRLFKHGCGIASTVLKWIPNFCNVYIISMLGKPNCVRNASSSHIPPLHHHPNHIMGVSRRRGRGRTMSELDTLTRNDVIWEGGEIESSFPSPATSAPSTTDGTLMYLSCLYEDMESSSSATTSLDDRFQGASDHVQEICLPPHNGITTSTNGASLLLTQKLESMKEGMKRLKMGGAKANNEHTCMYRIEPAKKPY